jgi:hypothetical protein
MRQGRQPGTYLVEDLAIGYVSSAHRLVETLAAPNEGKAKKPGTETGTRLVLAHKTVRVPVSLPKALGV